jgi:type II secretory pathway component PulF
LPANLAYLAEELKKKQLLKSKVVSAFVYPALITIATLGITAFLMLFLFPKITPIFTSLHADLPLSTKIVMASSVALQEWGIYFIVGAVGVSFLLSLLLQKNFNARLWFNRLCLKLPIVGTVIVYYNCSNISRTLGLLLKSGVTLTNALITSAKATPNLVYKNELIILSHVVERGDLMSLYLKKQPAYFPEVLCHMVAVGEKSGTLSNTLLYLAENYDNEVDEFTKNISTLVEPVLMIFMGILIGFIAISIITPIYGITQNLHG